MTLYYFFYIFFLTIGITISIYLFTRLWAIREAPGAYYLIWAVLGITVWSIAYVLEIALDNLPIKTIWLKAEYLGFPFISLALLAFTLVYIGRGNWLNRGRLILVAMIPIISLLFAITNDWHHLLWSSLQLPATRIGPIIMMHEPWYFVNVVYSYILLLLATFFLTRTITSRGNMGHSQSIIMLVGIIIPCISYVYYFLHPTLDWTPLAFTFTIVTFEMVFSRLVHVDRPPVAQSHVFNVMRDGVLIADTRGRIVEINQSAQRIFQQREEDLIGKDIQQIFPAWNEWNTQTGTAFEVSQEVAFGRGSARRNYGLRIAPILGTHGQVTGQMATLTDITEEKQAQSQMLLQSTALEAAENGIVITDSNGAIEWANPAFTRLTGYELYEAVGKNLKFLNSGQQPASFYKSLWETILAGKVWHGELINRRKNGTLYDEEMTITTLRENGIITHFIAIKQEVSERKRAEEQLRQAHEQAVDANRMKTQLLASVSHDLRTPLGTIMGYAEILQTGVLGKINSEQKKAAAEILDSANRLLVFVNNIIGQAQLETGRVVIRPRAFQPVELIDGIKSQVGLLIKKKGITFESEIDPSLPKQICADPYWLKQILLNLVNNALKFTMKGSVKVHFFQVNESCWALQVSDTGIGIPEESRRSIFEAFRQIDGRESFEGSGLGLSIVNQLTSLMKGKIDLESEIGRGSTFTVTLPLIIPEE